MQLSERPVIFMTYANAINKPKEYLPALGDERQVLRQELDLYDQKGWGIWKESPAAPEYLVRNLMDWHQQMVVFHFSGHATAKTLELVNRAGNSQSLDGQNLIGLLKASLGSLKLVFLNACLTKGHVEALQEIGVPAIVATNVKVNDLEARTFAQTFYAALVRGVPLQVAYDAARTAVASDRGERSSISLMEDDEEADPFENVPWEIFYQTPEAAHWTLKPENAIDARLREGSLQQLDRLIRKDESFPENLLTPVEAIKGEAVIVKPSLLLNRNRLSADKSHPEAQRPVEELISAEHRFGKLDLIQQLDENGYSHLVFQGAGGTRKTSALFYLWKQLNDSYREQLEAKGNSEAGGFHPIVLYIPLFEYNIWPQAQRNRFITQYILQHYLGEQSINPESEKHLWQWLKDPDWEHPYPKVLLLLDGLNEISVDKSQLLINIRRRWTDLSLPTRGKGEALKARTGVQILITGHTGTDFKWANSFSRFRLRPLTQPQIETYLQSRSPDKEIELHTLPNELTELLGNPTMLSIYADFASSPKGDTLSRQAQVSTPGELWDLYMRSFIDRAKTGGNRPSPYQKAFTQWQLHHLLPALCFQMMQQGRLEYRRMELREAIDGYLQKARHSLEDYYEVFPGMEQIWEKLEQESPDLIVSLRLTFSLLSEEQIFLKRRGQRISFLQQSYRRYFAARHIINELALSLQRETLPAALQEKPLPRSLRRMVGQVLREHLRIPEYDDRQRQWQQGAQSHTLLDQVLDFCRDNFDQKAISYLLWNLISIWRSSRGDLSGMNLGNLSLLTKNINLNELIVSRLSPETPGGYFTANFTGSRILPTAFFPEGHTERITAITSSPDGKIFLTAAEDNSIKIWSVRRGICLNTLHSPGPRVTTLSYHPTEARFLAGTEDGTISEWSVQQIWNTLDGVLLQTFAAHDAAILDLEYEGDGQKFISVGANNNLKVWEPGLGKNSPIALDNSYNMPRTAFEFTVGGTVILQGFRDGTCLLETIEKRLYTLLHTDAGPVHSVMFRISGGEEEIITGHPGRLIAWKEDATQDFAFEVSFSPKWEHDLGEEIPSAFLADHQRDWVIMGSTQGSISIWKGEGKTALHKAPRHHGSVTALCMPPDGRLLFSAGEDQRINQYDFAEENTEKPLTHRRVYKEHSAAITALAASNEFLISGAQDGSLKIYDIRPERGRNRPISRRFPHRYTKENNKEDGLTAGEESPFLRVGVTSISCHYSGAYFLVGYSNGSTLLWELDKEANGNARPLLQVRTSHRQPVERVSFRYSLEELSLLSQQQMPEFGAQLEGVIGYDNYEIHQYRFSPPQPDLEEADKKDWEYSCIDPDHMPISFQTSYPNTHWSDKPVDMVCIPRRDQLIRASHLGFHVHAYSAQERASFRMVSQINPGIQKLTAHPFEDRFISYQEDGSLMEWKRPPGSRTYQSRALEIASGDLTFMHYSLDGSNLLVGTESGDLNEWAIDSGENTRNFYSQRLEITHMAISPSGHRLLTVSDDKPAYYVIKEWDLGKRMCRAVYVLKKEVICDICYGQACESIFAATESGKIASFSTISGKALHTYEAPAECEGQAIQRLIYLPAFPIRSNLTQSYLVALYEGGSIFLWEEAREVCAGRLELPDFEQALSPVPTHLFSGQEPGSLILVTEEGTVHKGGLTEKGGYRFTPTQAPTPPSVYHLADSFTPLIAVRPDNKYVVKVDEEGFITETPIRTHFPQVAEKVFGAIYMDKKGLNQVFLQLTAEGKQSITHQAWNKETRNWKLKGSYPITDSAVTHLAIHPVGTGWMSAHEDGKLNLWDLTNPQLPHTIQSAQGRIEAITYSQAGDRIAFGVEGKVGIWDGQETLFLDVSSTGGAISLLLFAPEDDRLLVVRKRKDQSGDELIRWNFQTQGKTILHWKNDLAREVRTAKFGMRGTYLAVGMANGSISVWQDNSQDPVQVWEPTEGSAIVDVSPYIENGIQKFFSMSQEGYLRDWILGREEAVSLEHLPAAHPAAKVALHSGEISLIYPYADDPHTLFAHPIAASTKTFPFWEMPKPPPPGQISAIGYSQCGRILRVGYSSGHIVQWKRNGLEDFRVWEFDFHIPAHDDGECSRTRVTGFVAPPSVADSDQPERFFSASEDGTFREWHSETGELIEIWPNVPGMWMQGVDLREVGWARPLTKQETRLLKLYGAILD